MNGTRIPKLKTAELLHLKSQYVVAGELLDRAESELKARLSHTTEMRRQLAGGMKAIDAQLNASAQDRPRQNHVRTQPVAKPEPKRTKTRAGKAGGKRR
jgi:hypothetical protein